MSRHFTPVETPRNSVGLDTQSRSPVGPQEVQVGPVTGVGVSTGTHSDPRSVGP